MKTLLLNATSCVLSMFLLSGCLPLIFTGAAGTTIEFAKDRAAGDTLKDMRISTAIKANLLNKDFRNLYSKIRIEVIEGRVLLTGDIEKESDAIKAVEIAWNQEGVKEVINELKVSKNSNRLDIVQYTRDCLITSQIKSQIFLDKDIKFSNYTVITINDVVYLFGIGRSQEELEKVANIAANISSVEKVVSHVNLKP
jgi:osmotically-inducible protein OsmY